MGIAALNPCCSTYPGRSGFDRHFARAKPLLLRKRGEGVHRGLRIVRSEGHPSTNSPWTRQKPADLRQHRRPARHAVGPKTRRDLMVTTGLLASAAEFGGINVVATTAIATLINPSDYAGGTASIGPNRGSTVLQKATRRWTLDAGLDERPCAASLIDLAGFPARLGVTDSEVSEIIARPICIWLEALVLRRGGAAECTDDDECGCDDHVTERHGNLLAGSPIARLRPLVACRATKQT